MKHTWNAFRMILVVDATWRVGDECASGARRSAESGDKFKNLEFREIGPATDGRAHDDFRDGGGEQSQHCLRGHGFGRCLENNHNGTTGNRYSIRKASHDWRHRDRAIRPVRGVVGTGEPNNSAKLFLGRRRVQIARRRKDLEKDGAGLNAAHRGIAIHPKKPRCGLCRGARTSVGPIRARSV